MDFLNELKKVAMEELGVDATPVFNYKNLDPTYIQSMLAKRFDKSKDILDNLKSESEQKGLSFKQELYNLISQKSQSGYTRNSAETLLQGARYHNFINHEEYRHTLKQIFSKDPHKEFDEGAKENQEVMMKKELENSDPFAPLYL